MSRQILRSIKEYILGFRVVFKGFYRVFIVPLIKEYTLNLIGDPIIYLKTPISLN